MPISNRRVRWRRDRWMVRSSTSPRASRSTNGIRGYCRIYRPRSRLRPGNEADRLDPDPAWIAGRRRMVVEGAASAGESRFAGGFGAQGRISSDRAMPGRAGLDAERAVGGPDERAGHADSLARSSQQRSEGGRPRDPVRFELGEAGVAGKTSDAATGAGDAGAGGRAIADYRGAGSLGSGLRPCRPGESQARSDEAGAGEPAARRGE